MISVVEFQAQGYKKSIITEGPHITWILGLGEKKCYAKLG